jgi:IstB-like ATP binding protein
VKGADAKPPLGLHRPARWASRQLSLDFLEAARNVVLSLPRGLGKTTIAQSVALRAVVAGGSVLFLSAAPLLDLGAHESARALERAFRTTPRSDCSWSTNSYFWHSTTVMRSNLPGHQPQV